MNNLKKALLIAGIVTILLYNTSFAASRGFSWMLEQGTPENIRILKDNKYNKEYIVVEGVGITERITK